MKIKLTLAALAAIGTMTAVQAAEINPELKKFTAVKTDTKKERLNEKADFGVYKLQPDLVLVPSSIASSANQGLLNGRAIVQQTAITTDGKVKADSVVRNLLTGEFGVVTGRISILAKDQASLQELQQQFYEQDVRIDRVVVGSGSSGTHGGMVAGFLGNNIKVPLIGIGVSRDPADQEPLVHKEAQAVADLLGIGKVPREAVKSFGGFWQPKYSVPNAKMVEAVQMAARTEGILLDDEDPLHKAGIAQVEDDRKQDKPDA